MVTACGDAARALREGVLTGTPAPTGAGKVTWKVAAGRVVNATECVTREGTEGPSRPPPLLPRNPSDVQGPCSPLAGVLTPREPVPRLRGCSAQH